MPEILEIVVPAGPASGGGGTGGTSGGGGTGGGGGTPRPSSADAVALPSGAQELEILAGRRAFAVAQGLLAGGPVQAAVNLSVGWHDSSVNGESGSFAVVQTNGDLDDLIGEIVLVRFYSRSVFAYVLEDADVPVQLSLTRRLFLALNRLTVASLQCNVAPVA